MKKIPGRKTWGIGVITRRLYHLLVSSYLLLKKAS
jgi:hypothetical protein